LLRAYWHEWIPRWSDDFARFSAALLPTWGLPHTATDDERALFVRPGRAARDALLLVCSASYDMADMLCDALRVYGYRAVWQPDRETTRAVGVSAVIWDGRMEDGHKIAELRAVYPAAPIVALVDFPRLDEVLQAELAGATAVMGKPFMLDELYRQVDQLLAGPTKTATNLPEKGAA
jgi:DNA-binding NtrC family response regulator